MQCHVFLPHHSRESQDTGRDELGTSVSMHVLPPCLLSQWMSMYVAFGTAGSVHIWAEVLVWPMDHGNFQVALSTACQGPSASTVQETDAVSHSLVSCLCWWDSSPTVSCSCFAMSFDFCLFCFVLHLETAACVFLKVTW